MSFMQAPKATDIMLYFIEFSMEYAPRYTQALSTVQEAYVRYAISANTIPLAPKELKQQLKLKGALIMGDGRCIGCRLIRPHWNR